jgi:hypothetical protein
MRPKPQTSPCTAQLSQSTRDLTLQVHGQVKVAAKFKSQYETQIGEIKLAPVTIVIAGIPFIISTDIPIKAGYIASTEVAGTVSDDDDDDNDDADAAAAADADDNHVVDDDDHDQ